LFRLLVESARDFAMFTQDTQGRINSWNVGAERILGWTEDEAIGQPCDIIFTPEDRGAGVPERERATAREQGRAEDERWHVRKDGSRFWASGVMTSLTDEKGDFIGFAKVLRDLTERKRYEDDLQRAKEELEQRVQERTQALVEQTTRQRAQESELRRKMGARVEEERRRISRELHDQTGQHLIALGLELAALEQEATGVRQAAQRAAEAAAQAAQAVREAAEAAQTAAAVAVQIGATAEAARLAREASETARTAAITSTDAGAAVTAAATALTVVDEAAPRLTRLRALVDSLSRDLHRIAVDLRPYSLDDLGLVAALHGHIETWGQQTGIAVELESLGLEEGGQSSQRLPPEVETALYRIVQEALTNVAKHAADVAGDREVKRATRVSITLQRINGHVQVTIEDNGPGFDPETAGEGRLGLAGMRERATLLGGTLEIESTPGSGTTIFARLPVPSV
jgi:PAS domain S-box-containing protein